MEAKTVDVDNGWSWFVGGFQLFLQSPGIWILLGVVFLVLTVILLLIPILGGLILALIAPVFGAGFLNAARAADTQRTVEIGHLFQPFRDSAKLNRLLTLGAIAVAGALAAVLIAALTMGGSMMEMMAGGGERAAMEGMGRNVLLMLLIVLAVELLVSMALIYAVPLVIFSDALVGDAMRSSFDACVRNLLPLLLFGVVYLIAAIVASMPFMLGWLVLLPASAGMLYRSYKDIYEPASAVPP